MRKLIALMGALIVGVGMIITIPQAKEQAIKMVPIKYVAEHNAAAAGTAKAVAIVQSGGGHGTGWFIAKGAEGATLITNHHVVRGSSNDLLRIELIDGTELSGKVISFNRDFDLARVEVKATPEQLKKIKVLSLAEANALPGQSIYMLGNGGFEWFHISAGTADRLYQMKGFWNGRMQLARMAAIGGFSGSPVMDVNTNEVVGVLCGGFTDNSNKSIIIPLDLVKSFILDKTKQTKKSKDLQFNRTFTSDLSPEYRLFGSESTNAARAGADVESTNVKPIQGILASITEFCKPITKFVAKLLGFGPKADIIVKKDLSKIYMWISPEEIKALPMAGKAWESVLKDAKKAGRADIYNMKDPGNMYAYAAAIVYVRTGDRTYYNKVISTINDIMSGGNGRTLAVGRNLGTFAVTAQLVGLPKAMDVRFKSFLKKMVRRNLGGRTIINTHENRPNNWGTHSSFTRLAVAVYLNDHEEVAAHMKVFKTWLGDDQGHKFKFHELDWQADKKNPVGINPRGSKIQGHSVDGVLPDDQRRSGGFRWPPSKENYAYEALQGIIATCNVYKRLGYEDVMSWGDSAIIRAYKWFQDEANFEATGDDIWQIPLLNYLVGYEVVPVPKLNYAIGKNMGYTEYTHSK